MKKFKEFNVICYDINKRTFTKYDIMPYLLSKYKNLKKKDRPKEFNECKDFIKKESQYQWWSRCEYEIILTGWPNTDFHKKIDIYWQIMMNIDIITELFIQHIKDEKE